MLTLAIGLVAHEALDNPGIRNALLNLALLLALVVVGPLATVVSSWRVLVDRPHSLNWHFLALAVSGFLTTFAAALGGTASMGWFLLEFLLLLVSFGSTLVVKIRGR